MRIGVLDHLSIRAERVERVERRSVGASELGLRKARKRRSWEGGFYRS
jgi:hypothetical protein